MTEVGVHAPGAEDEGPADGAMDVEVAREVAEQTLDAREAVAYRSVLRERTEDDESGRVTSFELFFDLVFVFAVTQLSHLLMARLDWLGAAQTILLLLAVWWAWIDTAWVTNWLDPDHPTVRMMLIGVMLASLILSAALPEAFGERGLLFAGAYVAMQIGRPLFVIAASGSDERLRRNFQRILVWCVASSVFWLAGGLVEGWERELLWLIAILLDTAAPAVGFHVPGLGRSGPADWTIAGEHLAERCQLFVIVALGESIVVTGATFTEAGVTGVTVAALVAAFVGSVGLWWIYFHRSARYGAEVIASVADPGRLGRTAYTYFHLPMVAGIIVSAVGDELVIAHPGGPPSLLTACVVTAGPILFLAGHLLYKHALTARLIPSHLVGIVVLAALTPLGLVMAPLVVGIAAMVVVVGVAVWDSLSGWRPTEDAAAPA